MVIHEGPIPLLSFHSSSGAYKVEQYRRSKLGPNGEAYIVKVFCSYDDENTWQEIPLVLSWFSKLFSGFFATWPPESVDDLYCEDGSPCFEYRDKWIPYEKPVLPFKLDTESLWKACYQAKRHRWYLKRLRHLDYEGGKDKPT